MLKSLQSDILHEAESQDLKVIIISGTYLISILRVLQYPEEVSQNSLINWGIASLNRRNVLKLLYKNINYGKLLHSGGLGGSYSKDYCAEDKRLFLFVGNETLPHLAVLVFPSKSETRFPQV